MSNQTGERRLTAEQYRRLDDDGHYRLELERGRVIREPLPGAAHAELTVRLGYFLYDFVQRNDLGRVFGEVGVITEHNPDSVRGPDLALASWARASAYPGAGFLEIAPELCVEILSPSNRASRMQQKVVEYLNAGARLVWVLDPINQRATVYRSTSDIQILGSNDVLNGYDVLPGFELLLSKLFESR